MRRQYQSFNHIDYEIVNQNLYGYDIRNIKYKNSDVWPNNSNLTHVQLELQLHTPSFIGTLEFQFLSKQLQIQIKLQCFNGSIQQYQIQKIDKHIFFKKVSTDNEVLKLYIKIKGQKQNPIRIRYIILRQISNSLMKKKLKKNLSNILKFQQSTYQESYLKDRFLQVFSKFTWAERTQFYLGDYSKIMKTLEIFPYILYCSQKCLMKTIDIQQFYLSSHQLNYLIKPKFQNLTCLSLFDCSIDNIQSFIFLNAPNLQQLWLGQSNITILKSIKKFNTKKLKILSLFEDHIKCYQQLPHIQHSQEGLKVDIGYDINGLNHLIKVKKINSQDLFGLRGMVTRLIQIQMNLYKADVISNQKNVFIRLGYKMNINNLIQQAQREGLVFQEYFF